MQADNNHEPPDDDDGAAELLEQAQLNAQAMIFATAAYLQQTRHSLDEWARSLGESFARAWDDGGEEWEAGEFLEAMIVNFRALGATVLDSELGPDMAWVTMEGFPSEELAEALGIDVSLADRFNDTVNPIAGARGLTWRWEREGATTRYEVNRSRR